MQQSTEGQHSATIIPFPSARESERLADTSLAQAGGDARLHYLVGLMYEYGRGVSPDLHEAVNWYRRAATAGLAHAQNSLGFLYTLGQGIERDDEQAREWFYRAAGQGHSGAQLNLGLMFCAGRGVTRDERLAVYWFHRAAKGGNRQARELLAQAYKNGWYGLPRNADEACYWSERVVDA